MFQLKIGNKYMLNEQAQTAQKFMYEQNVYHTKWSSAQFKISFHFRNKMFYFFCHLGRINYLMLLSNFTNCVVK
jgi:hypothetical protein